MQWLLLLLILPCVLGCEKLSNQLQSQILDCGEAARNGEPWIKVVDPQGQELPAAELLDARILELTGGGDLSPPLAISEKHCVNAQGATRFVIRSLARDRSWGALADLRDNLSPAVVRLQDNSQARVRLRCPDPWIHNGRFKLPLEMNGASGLEAWALAPRLVNSNGGSAAENFSLGTTDNVMIWPNDWTDGPGQLVLRQKNLLQNPSSPLAEREESCPMMVDRERPKLVLTPAPASGGELEMQPGALLRLKIDDPHPASLRWCLHTPAQDLCEIPAAWQSASGEVSLPMPDQGRWILRTEAKDAAGNEAESLQLVIDIVRRDLLQGIAARVDQALAEKNEKSWEATQSLVRALVDYRRLSIAKEKDQVRSKLVSGILGTAPYLQEYQRATLQGSGQRAWALDESPTAPWIVLSDNELTLWSVEGKLLQTLPVPSFRVADWSVSQQALALGTDDELWVIPLAESKFLMPKILRWMDYKDIRRPPNKLHWIPGQMQIVVTFPDSEAAIVGSGPAGLTMPQRIDSFDSLHLTVAPDGSKFATVDGESMVKVWRVQNGIWTLADKAELSVASFSFTGGRDEKRLLVLTKDGRIITWTPGVLWKDQDSGAEGEIPTDSVTGDPLQHVQAWADGSTGLIEKGGRFYQWFTDPGKTLQPLKLSGFSWDTLRNWKVDPCQKGLWLQDNDSLSYWEWQDTGEVGFKKIADWQTATADPLFFAVRCYQDQKKFLTISGSRLRFWSQYGPLPQVRGDKGEVVISRFEKGRDSGETLFTAGFDGVIRLWNARGQKLQEWLGHRGQVNELRFIPEWKAFVSSAEDSTSRVWTTDGQAGGTLSLTDVLGAVWRDAALAFDDKHLLTAGKGALAIWSQNFNRNELTITIPVDPGERPGFDSLVRLPGSPRILVRLMKGHAGRAVVVTPDGSLVTEAGLPPLQKIRWIEWTPDGARLALSDSQQKPHIYRHENGQWQEETIAITGPANLSRFAFAPDGMRFAAVRGGSLVIGQRNADQWSILQDIPLASTAFDKGVQWTADSSRLVYAQAGLVSVRDREGKMEHQFQAFPGTDPLNSLGLSQDPDILAVGSGPWVRIIDLNLDRLQTQLCSWLDAWIQGPDAPPEFSVLCTK